MKTIVNNHREAVALMESLGFVLNRTGKHDVWKKGTKTFVTPRSPSDHRAYRNMVAQLRRIGELPRGKPGRPPKKAVAEPAKAAPPAAPAPAPAPPPPPAPVAAPAPPVAPQGTGESMPPIPHGDYEVWAYYEKHGWQRDPYGPYKTEAAARVNCDKHDTAGTKRPAVVLRGKAFVHYNNTAYERWA